MSRPQDRIRRLGFGLCTSGAFAGIAILALCLLRGYAQSAQPPTVSSATAAPVPTASQPHPSTESSTRDPKQLEIEGQCADLVKLAANLKAEVNKSGKDQLSVTAVREATLIEELARKLRTQNAK